MKPITEQERQELIAYARIEISRWVNIPDKRYISELIEIALTSLTEVPVGFCKQHDVESLQRGEFAGISPSDQECRVSLYTAAPVPVIKLPDDHKIDGVGSLAYASGYEDGHKDAIELVKRLNGLK